MITELYLKWCRTEILIVIYHFISVKVYRFYVYIYIYVCILDIFSVWIWCLEIIQDPPDRSLMTHRDFMALREQRNAQDSPG